VPLADFTARISIHEIGTSSLRIRHTTTRQKRSSHFIATSLALSRPISLLPLLLKVLEKLVVKQLTAHPEKHNLLARFQSSFRRSHSSETAVVRIANDILSSNESGKVTALVL